MKYRCTFPRCEHGSPYGVGSPFSCPAGGNIIEALHRFQNEPDPLTALDQQPPPVWPVVLFVVLLGALLILTVAVL